MEVTVNICKYNNNENHIYLSKGNFFKDECFLIEFLIENNKGFQKINHRFLSSENRKFNNFIQYNRENIMKKIEEKCEEINFLTDIKDYYFIIEVTEGAD